VVLRSKLELGLSTRETIARLRDAFAPFTGGADLPAYRLEAIVRTESTSAFNMGRLVEARDADIAEFMTGMQYSAILDSRTSAVCTHLDGKVFKMSDGDLDTLVGIEGIVRQRQEVATFLLEDFCHLTAALLGTAALGGRPRHPFGGLAIELFDGLKLTRCEEVIADVANGALHASLFISQVLAYIIRGLLGSNMTSTAPALSLSNRIFSQFSPPSELRYKPLSSLGFQRFPITAT